MNKETGMHAHCSQLYKHSGMEQKQQPNAALSFKKGCKKVRPMGNFVRLVSGWNQFDSEAGFMGICLLTALKSCSP